MKHNLTFMVMHNSMLYPVIGEVSITTKKFPSLSRIRNALKAYGKKYNDELLQFGECVGVSEKTNFMYVSGLPMTFNHEFTI